VIPLRDRVRSRSFPVVNLLLILANFVVFMHELGLTNGGLTRFLETWGMIPAAVVHAYQTGALSPTTAHIYATLVTAEFVHGGWVHILGNMVFLWVFGDNVEDRMGHGRYLIFYVVVGAIGNVLFAALNPAATVPTIGASGSIAGVLGAYLLSFPRARVLTVVFILFFVTVVEIPAVVLLLYWFALQILNGLATLGGAEQAAGVAWWAHVGGFIAGMLLLPIFARQPAWRAP
jgi:membrane associated rhomboid family serine protease